MRQCAGLAPEQSDSDSQALRRFRKYATSNTTTMMMAAYRRSHGHQPYVARSTVTPPCRAVIICPAQRKVKRSLDWVSVLSRDAEFGFKWRPPAVAPTVARSSCFLRKALLTANFPPLHRSVPKPRALVRFRPGASLSTRTPRPDRLSKTFPQLSVRDDLQEQEQEKTCCFQRVLSGRTWDRTRDLSRVKRALSR